MARRRKTKAPSPASIVTGGKSKGNNTNLITILEKEMDMSLHVPLTADASKTRTLADLSGIPPLDMDEDVMVADEEGEWTKVTNKRSTNSISPSKSPTLIKFTLEDVQPELEYWESAVYCYVAGARPPKEVITGFVKHIWGVLGVDNVLFMPNGIFLVRFKDKEAQNKALMSGYHMFDNKPLIVKPWAVGVELAKEDLTVVPFWIRLKGLALKFWGEKCIMRLAESLGKPIQCDTYTKLKTFLGAARVMVEMKINQTLVPNIKFEDELGIRHSVLVEYEWKPIICSKCKGMGHAGEECRKSQEVSKPVWRPKVQQKGPQQKVQQKTDQHQTVQQLDPVPVPYVREPLLVVTPEMESNSVDKTGTLPPDCCKD